MKMKSYWIRVGLNAMTAILVKRRTFRHRSQRGETATRNQRQRLESDFRKSRNDTDCHDHHQPGENRKESVCPRDVRESRAWLIRGFQTSGLQKRERINSFIFSHPACDNLLTTALGNWSKEKVKIVLSFLSVNEMMSRQKNQINDSRYSQSPPLRRITEIWKVTDLQNFWTWS